MDEFGKIAKELKLSQVDAQSVINKMAPLIVKNDAARIAELSQTAANAWVTSSKADKEFGGDKFDENRAIALKAFDAFGTPELKQLLIDSHLGDHPEVIRWAYRVGKNLGPDNKFVHGDNVNTEQAGTFEERAAAKLYKK
jgi:hypothetical protein